METKLSAAVFGTLDALDARFDCDKLGRKVPFAVVYIEFPATDDWSDFDVLRAASTSRTPEATLFPTTFSYEDEPGAPTIRKVKARKIERIGSRFK